MTKWRPAKAAQMLLLEPRTECFGQEAIGTGIIPVCGSARSGKSTLALALMEWAAEHTQRDLVFMGLPDAYIEALPPKMRSRATNPPMAELSKQRDAIVLMDDTATNLSSRDSGSNQGRMISRVSGVISHLGLTIILTTQSMAGIDLSLLRFTMMSPLVKRVDAMALRVERSEWSNEIKEAQSELSRFNFERSMYWSIADEHICKAPYSEWMGQDILSRPFRYLEQDELELIINGPSQAAKRKKVKKNVTE
jgi:hypothetical protein